tara:strand:+ start:916 stop:1191 length:276 start_codon:yes stop_codon:yes gene_type:complete
MKNYYLKLNFAAVTKGLPRPDEPRYVSTGPVLIPLDQIKRIEFDDEFDPEIDVSTDLHRYLLWLKNNTYVGTDEDVEAILKSEPKGLILEG